MYFILWFCIRRKHAKTSFLNVYKVVGFAAFYHTNIILWQSFWIWRKNLLLYMWCEQYIQDNLAMDLEIKKTCFIRWSRIREILEDSIQSEGNCIWEINERSYFRTLSFWNTFISDKVQQGRTVKYLGFNM